MIMIIISQEEGIIIDKKDFKYNVYNETFR